MHPKKKATVTLQSNAKPGELYWARLKGYPAWPAVIADEQMLPESLLASRPVSTEQSDGSLREDFRPDGKNAKDRTFPIMFLATNEFAWLVNTALSPLDPEQCKNKPAKLSKQLSDAYDVAAGNPGLDHFRNLLQQFQEESATIAAQEEQRAAEAAEKAAAKAEKEAKQKEKKARKSAGGDGDVTTEDAGAPTKSKKRKNESNGDDDGKPKKTPKTLKLNAPKQNGDAAKTPTSKPKKKIAAPKSNGDSAEQKPQMSEADRLAQREKGVLYLRHRLQKAFLSGDSAPKEEEMPNMNEFFVQLEGYDNLEPAIIRKTKIHKVLKAIIKLNSVPKDDDFNFKKRSQTMLEAWNKSMEANGDTVKPAAEEKSPVTNGEVEKPKEDTLQKTEGDVSAVEAEKQADELDTNVEKAEAAEPKEEPAAEEPAVENPATEEAKDTKPVGDGDGDVTMAGAEDKAVEA